MSLHTSVRHSVHHVVPTTTCGDCRWWLEGAAMPDPGEDYVCAKTGEGLIESDLDRPACSHFSPMFSAPRRVAKQ